MIILTPKTKERSPVRPLAVSRDLHRAWIINDLLCIFIQCELESMAMQQRMSDTSMQYWWVADLKLPSTKSRRSRASIRIIAWIIIPITRLRRVVFYHLRRPASSPSSYPCCSWGRLTFCRTEAQWSPWAHSCSPFSCTRSPPCQTRRCTCKHKRIHMTC